MVSENQQTEKYWLWSDNALAALVLKDYAPDISKNITNSIDYLDDYIQFRSAYGTILGKEPSFQAPVNKNITDKIWYTDFAGDNELQCSDYADIAFLKAIHYYRMGDYQRSVECYQTGREMFDGIGFRDRAYAADGNRYSTYKLALWYIANDLVKREADVAEHVREILSKMQDKETGGVYTHYTSALKPDSQTNVETTSLAILAFDSSLLQPNAQSPTPEILQRCGELGIAEANCSEKALLGKECVGTSCGRTLGGDRIEVLQDLSMLAILGVLAAGVASGTAIFLIKMRKGSSETETLR
ncbi:MAG TPA: hypothetical protein VNI77_01870 [Nitrososphaera sp.]|nr:hypothetical protein [Nitrososphaera sp.]